MKHHTSMARWWKCCGKEKTCDREVNSDLFGTTCPDCGHEKCEYCSEIETPTPIRDESDYQHQYADDLQPVEYTSDIRPVEYTNDFYAVEYADALLPVECTQQPSMRGWWRCCECSADNNPQTVGNSCPGPCYHDKCSGCYIHQQ